MARFGYGLPTLPTLPYGIYVAESISTLPEAQGMRKGGKILGIHTKMSNASSLVVVIYTVLLKIFRIC